ncbi:MAG: EamA family transporter [Oscillospiraceae bacterium]|nr:EamA family transporter [Oscillospiraceae bacterium]
MNYENRKKGIVEMLICAALWSSAGILIKLLPWNGFAVASIRSLIAGLTILIYALSTGRRMIINRKTLLAGLLTAGVYTCFSCANKMTTAANAIVLQFTCPVFIVLLSAVFLKKRMRLRDVVTVILTLGGITLVFLDKLEGGYLLGNLVAILAGLLMAGMYVSVGEMEENSRFSSIILGQFITFLIGLPLVIYTRPVLTTVTVLSILALGVLQLGISYILYIHASINCPPLACCLLGGLEPLLNPVWVMLFDGETPGILALVGGIAVVVTITVWCALDSKSTAPAAETVNAD